jgi:hypothetical protein
MHNGPCACAIAQVLATSYVAPGKFTVVSVASWAPQNQTVNLVVDWATLGLSPATSTMMAPAITGFQPEVKFTSCNAPIVVEPGKGWILVIASPSSSERR